MLTMAGVPSPHTSPTFAKLSPVIRGHWRG
jgi:hypothetical protein